MRIPPIPPIPHLGLIKRWPKITSTTFKRPIDAALANRRSQESEFSPWNIQVQSPPPSFYLRVIFRISILCAEMYESITTHNALSPRDCPLYMSVPTLKSQCRILLLLVKDNDVLVLPPSNLWTTSPLDCGPEMRTDISREQIC
jgi:hypothetical protein